MAPKYQRAMPEAASSSTPPPKKERSSKPRVPREPVARAQAPERQAEGFQETVTIACKLPTGMILQLAQLMDIPSPAPMDPHRTVKEWKPVGDKITVNGPKVPFGFIPEYRIVAGYALTDGIPKAFWDEWIKQHKDDPSVRNNLIFAHGSTSFVVDKAKDHRTVISGLEPLKQDNDPRVVKDTSNKEKRLKVERAEEMEERT